MSNLVKLCALALLATAASQASAQTGPCCGPSSPCLVQRCLVITKSYKIEPGFCPLELARIIPQCVPACATCPGCGPYGIPPIYTAGSYVLIRQTPEVHDRIAEYLKNLGAYVPIGLPVSN